MQSASPCEDLFGIMHGIIKSVPDIRKAENSLCLIVQLHSGEFFRDCMCINIRILPLLKDRRIVSPFCPCFLQTKDYKYAHFMRELVLRIQIISGDGSLHKSCHRL